MLATVIRPLESESPQFGEIVSKVIRQYHLVWSNFIAENVVLVRDKVLEYLKIVGDARPFLDSLTYE